LPRGKAGEGCGGGVWRTGLKKEAPYSDKFGVPANPGPERDVVEVQ